MTDALSPAQAAAAIAELVGVIEDLLVCGNCGNFGCREQVENGRHTCHFLPSLWEPSP